MKLMNERDSTERVENATRCIYPTCITNKPREPITPRFKIVSRSPLLLQCEYCGRYIEEPSILKQPSRR
jgi:aspartate carbamoyltransferase regulatory subunit